MELRQLRYFIQIADSGSLSKASGVLHIAQPALSQQMALLEGELGQRLLSRLHTGVQVTEQGAVFYQHAQRVLKQVQEIKGAVTATSDAPSGPVALGLPQSTAQQFAFALLPRLQRDYPAIKLEFFDELSGHLLQGLHSGRLDVSVVVNNHDATLLQSTPLLDEALYLVSHPRMAPKGKVRGKGITLKQLAKLPLAIPGKHHGVRSLVDTALAAQGLSLSGSILTVNSMGIMRRCMLDGLAHCVMPWGAVAPEIASGALVATIITPRIERRVYICTAKDTHVSLATQTVAKLLLEAARECVRTGQWQGNRLL